MDKTDEKQHMEHYTSTISLNATTGILHHTRAILTNRFCGRLFILSDRVLTFPQYLTALFPSARPSANNPLDRHLLIDHATVEKREFTAQRVGRSLKRLSLSTLFRGLSPQAMQSPLSSSSSQLQSQPQARSPPPTTTWSPASKKEKRKTWEFATAREDAVEVARRGARAAEGKTARELSRLWRYEAGERPVGEGWGVGG